ncbi:hypothetical protein JB92DRAFT_2927681, partial [Gautieria morchelliformis]
LWGFVKIIDRFGVEVRRIERVQPHERTPVTSRDWMDNLWRWLAANCTISTLALRTLGPLTFSLTSKISILTIVFFNLLSTVLYSCPS